MDGNLKPFANDVEKTFMIKVLYFGIFGKSFELTKIILVKIFLQRNFDN